MNIDDRSTTSHFGTFPTFPLYKYCIIIIILITTTKILHETTRNSFGFTVQPFRTSLLSSYFWTVCHTVYDMMQLSVKCVLCTVCVCVCVWSVLIEGVLFRARYLGSTQLISDGQPSKAVRMLQAQEAIARIKVQYALPGLARPGWARLSLAWLSPAQLPVTSSMS